MEIYGDDKDIHASALGEQNDGMNVRDDNRSSNVFCTEQKKTANHKAGLLGNTYNSHECNIAAV